MTMPSDPNWYVGAAWSALSIVWVLAAFSTKKTERSAACGGLLTRLRSFCIMVNPKWERTRWFWTGLRLRAERGEVITEAGGWQRPDRGAGNGASGERTQWSWTG